MATRSIVTSQPDVACDVCERRLLRGEQPDAFLAAGRRRIVCELCAPRAVQEGWLRETDEQSLSLPAMRPRRGRNLFDRLRQVARPPADANEATGQNGSQAGRQAPYDFLDAHGTGPRGPVPARVRERSPAPTHPDGHAHMLAQDALAPEQDLAQVAGAGAASTPAGEETPPAALAKPPSELERAVQAFNTSEHPRRVAGVARSLGAPVVSVHCSEHARSVVQIVVAWELCWYRYAVDLDETPPEARVLAQGVELGELAPEELLANALAEQSGTLLLADAQPGSR